jgi:hypothetical protein
MSEHLKRNTFRPGRHAGPVDVTGAPINVRHLLPAWARDRLLEELPPGQRHIVRVLTDVYWDWPQVSLKQLLSYAAHRERLERLRGAKRPDEAAIALAQQTVDALLVALRLDNRELEAAIEYWHELMGRDA